jgi:ferrous iron transport protein A
MVSPVPLPLSRVSSGSKAMVVGLAGGREFQTRLLGMGLNVGCEISVIRACGGDSGPALVAVGASRLAIGHGMAAKVMVRLARR